MKELILDENRSVIIVSHSLDVLSELCTDILWLHEGEMKMLGEPQKVLTEYSKFMIAKNREEK